MRLSPALVLLLAGCSTDSAVGGKQEAPADDGVQWDEYEELEAGDDDKGDDSGAYGDYPPSDDDVEAGVRCEGDWTTTTCLDEEGAYWWCQDGQWTSDK
jgi:hypothetical protein